MRVLLPSMLLLAALGCGGSTAKSRLDSVDPATVPFGLDGGSVSLGGVFIPALAVSLDHHGPPQLNDQFQVTVGEQLCPSVVFQSQSALQATLPGGLLPGAYDVTVVDPGGGRSTLPRALTIEAGKPVGLAFVTPQRSTRPNVATDHITVGIRDSDGHLAPLSQPTQLTLVTQSKTGLFIPDTGPADAGLTVALPAGTASYEFRYQDSSAGYWGVTASAPGLASANQVVVIGSFGDPAKVAFVSPPTAPLPAGAIVQLTVAVEDNSGGPPLFPPQGIQVTVSSSAPGAALSLDGASWSGQQVSFVANSQNGQANVYYRQVSAPRSDALVASGVRLDRGDQLTDANLSLAFVPAALDHFDVTWTGSPPIVAGVATSFVLGARDAFENPVDFTGTVSLSSSPADPFLTPLGAALTDGGLAAVAVTFTRRQFASLTVADGAQPPHQGSSVALQVHPGPLASHTVSTPGTVQAGVPFSVTLGALDAYGNPIEVANSVMLSAPNTAGTLLPTGWTILDGQAQLQATSTKATPVTELDVNDGGALSAASGPFQVAPGPFNRFAVGDTGNQQAGAGFPVTVSVTDAYGNLTSESHSVTLAVQGVDGGSFGPTLASVQGATPVPITIYQAIQNTRISVSELISGQLYAAQQASAFNVLPGPYAQVGIRAPTCVQGGTYLYSVSAEDAWGNITPNSDTVTLSVDQGCNFSPSSVNLSQGTVSFNGTLGGPLLTNIPCVNFTATDSTASKSGHVCIKYAGGLGATCP